ncbi:hypothetical protein FK85_26560, partial [Halorubrum saccharovorum]
MDFAWDIDREGDVSLVRCRVRNDAAVPRRVRIESRLAAPVLPPRRGGVPEDGWDEAGVTLRLDPGERRAIGFAARVSSTDPPADPPVEVAEVEAVDLTEQPGGPESSERDEKTASATAAALRRLGDHRPPRDVVTAEVDSERGADRTDKPDLKTESGGSDHAVDGADAADIGDPAGGSDAPASLPGEATGWFDAVEARLNAVEERIDRAERLTDADLATATEAVAEADGAEGITGLHERVAADANRLRALIERAASLAALAEE